LFQNPNFLILDEPTNDLDLPTLSVLENFLLEFPGCLLIVSHDRYFMDRVVDHLFVFTGEGQIKDFTGNYSQYREEKAQINTLNKESISGKSNLPAPPTNIPKNGTENRINYKEKREFEQLEKEMEKLAEHKDQLTTKLNEVNLPFEILQETALELEKTIQQLEQKEMRWLELVEKI
jgi:ATP-binding cassette subfamily F protein uup